MKIAITGATGYIGGQFVKMAHASGHEIVALCRRNPDPFGCVWVSYNLSSTQAPVLPVDTKAVLHLATSKSLSGQQDSEQEILAAGLLIIATQKVGAKLVFVSSQTARSDAPTAYGRTKWSIEQEVLSAGGWVVRPGQVYGGELRGLFGVLVKIVRQLPVLPLFEPAPKVQPIHVDDLSEGLLRIIEHTDLTSGVYCLAAPEPVSFSKFLGEIAQSRLRCWRGFVPVPVVIINALMFVLGESLRTRLGLERLRSLFNLPLMATASDLKQLGLTLRPLRSGMHPSGSDRRRCLLLEGQALITYVLKEPAGGALLRRYVRAIEKLRDGSVLALPKLFVQWPALLALVDGSGSTETAWRKEFLWRLDGATILAEATPLGARRFLGIGDRHGFARSLFQIARAMVSEISWRILSLLFLPVIHIVLPCSLEERP
jgi:uncharacterized protein YbjT (DUF2867 family)